MWVLRVNDSCFFWDKTFSTEEFEYNYQPMGFVNNDKRVIRLFAGEYIFCSVDNDFRLLFRIPTGQTEKQKAINQIRPVRINGLTESLVLLAETTTTAT